MTNKTKTILACVACLIVGYFIGREHLKYQMRSAMQDVVKEMQSGFASVLGDNTEQKSEENKTEKTHVKDQPLTVEILKKGFSPKDLDNRKFEEEVTFALNFINKTGKDIRAFDGVVEFTDLLGNRIIASRVEINERVVQGGSLNWDGALEYNQFMNDHERLRSEPIENLKVSFHVNKILFADNTMKEYE